MPGIESFGRRRSDVSEDLRVAQELRELYQRALTTANKYIPLKIGPGTAPFAGMLLNYIFADEVLRPDNPEDLAAAREFAAVDPNLLADRAKELLESLPALRRALIPTLWVKRFMDLAAGKNSVVAALDRSSAFVPIPKNIRRPRSSSMRSLFETLRSSLVLSFSIISPVLGNSDDPFADELGGSRQDRCTEDA